MKLLIMSDSHGSSSDMERAYASEKPDGVIFLGDGLNDFKRFVSVYPSAKTSAVKGNCDLFSHITPSFTEKYGTITVYACHGHTHGVKNGLSSLLSAAEYHNADIALFGHTHTPYCEKRGNVTLFNPGSIGCNGSYGLIIIDGEIFKCINKSI